MYYIILIFAIAFLIFFIIKASPFRKNNTPQKNLPKKLWLLRVYVKFLNLIAEISLFGYVSISIINLFNVQTILGNFILGVAGLYIVLVSLAILMLSQIILLFISIHDNIDDMRKKALDQNFTVNLVAENENENSKGINSVVLITLIILSILFSISSLIGVIKNDNSTEYSNQQSIQE